MTHGIMLALAAAFIYGFFALSYDIAARRHYQIWDILLYMQFKLAVRRVRCRAV